jgi:hypothetical protein
MARREQGAKIASRRAPYTFMTPEAILVAFDLESLRDLPDREQLEALGIAEAPP